MFISTCSRWMQCKKISTQFCEQIQLVCNQLEEERLTLPPLKLCILRLLQPRDTLFVSGMQVWNVVRLLGLKMAAETEITSSLIEGVTSIAWQFFSKGFPALPDKAWIIHWIIILWETHHVFMIKSWPCVLAPNKALATSRLIIMVLRV